MSFLEHAFSFLQYGLPLFLAIVLHEIAHGFVALKFGDTTAKNLGRLTLNPLRHIDMIGTVIFPTLLILTNAPFVFGWAKPVPVNFSALRNPKKDMIWVALAGPLTNFALAIFAFIVLSVCQNGFDMMPPIGMTRLLVNMMIFNFSLMVFNLVPILPMDGGRVLTGLLPMRLAVKFARTEKYGFIILTSLLIFLPIIGDNIGQNFNFVSRFLAFCVQGLMHFFIGVFSII